MLIRMEVVEFTSKHRPAHRAWNRPEVAEGTTLYAIEYSKGGYFTYSYRSREAAEYMKRTMIAEGTDTDQHYGFNVVGDVHRTITSGLGVK
ncbi:MAG TPA: hypothetical protein VKV41_23925 [Methylomirabilota bacterium]|nr:hypothetical protein [Methylomirabilota bacterium]